jgi:hypothetical protein
VKGQVLVVGETFGHAPPTARTARYSSMTTTDPRQVRVAPWSKARAPT